MSVSCGLSNLILNEGDEVGFVILGRNEFSVNRVPSSDYGVSDFGHSTDLYKPFLPPVFGTLGEYLQVDGIADSATTSALMELFNRPATDVLRCISSWYSVYSTNGVIYETYFSGDGNWHNFGKSQKESLETLGFRSHDVTATGVSYEFEGYTLHSEVESGYLNVGLPRVTWSIVDTVSGVDIVEPFGHTDIPSVMDRFSHATGLYPGFEREDYQRIALLNSLSGMFFLKEVYDTMSEYLTSSDPARYKDEFASQWETTVSLMDMDPQSEGMVKALMSPYLRLTCLPANVQVLRLYGTPDDLYPIYELIEVVGMLNRVITPSVWCTRYSSDEASQKLNDVTSSILAERQAEYEQSLAETGE